MNTSNTNSKFGFLDYNKNSFVVIPTSTSKSNNISTSVVRIFYQKVRKT